jgi:arylsulfatase A-like enzyme
MIVCAAVLLAGATIASEPPVTSDVVDRPNIIFLLTDDQRDGTFSGMGHPVLKTPHVDELLTRSVRFRNTYVASPVCAQSRISFLTGMNERVHGVGFSSSYQLTQEQWEQTYPALLQKAGYFTGFIGKFGVEYYTFRGRAGEKFDFFNGHDGWTKFLPKDFDSPSCTPYHDAQNNVITAIMGEAMTSFLDDAPQDKPFCLSVSFNVPHGSQATSMYPGYKGWHSMTRPASDNPALEGTVFYDQLHRDGGVEIPPATATDPYRFIPRFIMDQDKGRRTQTYTYNYTRESNLEHHIRYDQMITGLDHVIGELIDDLTARDLLERTVIIFASDHGLLMGEYGMGGKGLLYDLSAKIPCFVFDPSMPPSQQGTMSEAIVSSIDLTQTILDYARVDPPEFMDGRSLRPLVEKADAPWRDDLFLESLFTLRDTPFQEGIRTQRWKYVRMFDGVVAFAEKDTDFSGRQPEFEMLFDLTADPVEQVNLIESMADSDELASLRARCAAGSAALNARRTLFLDAMPVQRR